MKLSLGLPHYGKESSPEVIARFAREAEQLDYDAVWALERLLRPIKPRSAPFPGWTPPAYYANVYDPIETLTFVATKTRRIKLGTSVIDALFHVPDVEVSVLRNVADPEGGVTAPLQLRSALLTFRRPPATVMPARLGIASTFERMAIARSKVRVP